MQADERESFPSGTGSQAAAVLCAGATLWQSEVCAGDQSRLGDSLVPLASKSVYDAEVSEETYEKEKNRLSNCQRGRNKLISNADQRKHKCFSRVQNTGRWLWGRAQ